MTSLATETRTVEKADREIAACLDLDAPKSFFLFAGAGSGKTGSLVSAIAHLLVKFERRLRMRRQAIAVITYTNAACDEIQSRLLFDPLVEVSTIHSFVWKLIKGFNSDIRTWLESKLLSDISELKEEIDKTKNKATKTYAERVRSLESKQRRVAELGKIKEFTYNPNGDNRERESLSHSEVVEIAADFLSSKPLMQALLISRNPILLIDESQDTSKILMTALLKVQEANDKAFCLGLFGDMMQRIYADGLPNLQKSIPPTWDVPEKVVNYRCPSRIVKLINRIRSVVDDHEQRPREGAKVGVIRLFVVPAGVADKAKVEEGVRNRMAQITGDNQWAETSGVKALILEHLMAARRMGFAPMFEALSHDSLRTGLMDGSLSGVAFFSNLVLPLIEAQRRKDAFATAAIVRSASPLLDKGALIGAGSEQLRQLEKAQAGVDSLSKLWIGQTPTFRQVLYNITESRLFKVPEVLQPFAIPSEGKVDDRPAGTELSREEAIRSAWDEFLSTPFDQISQYREYVEGRASFDTHQGVKGLQFPRVMVIASDTDAGGFLFSYEKLFGAAGKTANDLRNEREGKETGIDRTRRLFYVTCSRAEEGLAIVAYSECPGDVRQHLVREGWFEEKEIELVAP